MNLTPQLLKEQLHSTVILYSPQQSASWSYSCLQSPSSLPPPTISLLQFPFYSHFPYIISLNSNSSCLFTAYSHSPPYSLPLQSSSFYSHPLIHILQLASTVILLILKLPSSSFTVSLYSHSPHFTVPLYSHSPSPTVLLYSPTPPPPVTSHSSRLLTHAMNKNRTDSNSL